MTLLSSFYLAAKTLGVGPLSRRRSQEQPVEDVPDEYRLVDGLVRNAEIQGTPRTTRMARSAVEVAEVRLGKEMCADLRRRVDALKSV